jgi:hypothetical protein
MDVDNDNPNYKKDRPLDCVMYVAMYGKCMVLDYIGPFVDYLAHESSLEDQIEQDVICENDVGVYIWSGCGEQIQYFAGDYDVQMNGDYRLATKEEWEHHVNDEYPWDRSLWMED